MLQQLELEQEAGTVAPVSQRNKQAMHRGDIHYLQM